MDKWHNDLAEAVRFAADLQANIARLGQLQRQETAYIKLSADVRNKQTNLDNRIQTLATALRASAPLVATAEYDTGAQRLNELRTMAETARRSFASVAGGPGGSSIWGGSRQQAVDTDNSGEDVTVALSNDQLLQEQRLAMQAQDRSLDALSEIISRQKNIAVDIGREVDLHNEILDDINDRAERVDRRLIQESRHVGIVTRKSGSCVLWIIIVLLLIVIVIVAAVPGSSKSG